MVRLLRAHGARITLVQAVQIGDVQALKTKLEEGIPADQQIGYLPTALSVAASLGSVKMMQILLEYGADVNHRGPPGTMPLIYAAQHGQLEAIQLLLAHGAKVNVEAGETTPLEAAIAGKQ